MTDEWTSLGEAVDLLMKRGMSRRQAKRFLIKGLRDGTVKSRGTKVVDGMNLGSAELPPEFWQGPMKDNEGDEL